MERQPCYQIEMGSTILAKIRGTGKEVPLRRYLVVTESIWDIGKPPAYRLVNLNDNHLTSFRWYDTERIIDYLEGTLGLEIINIS